MCDYGEQDLYTLALEHNNIEKPKFPSAMKKEVHNKISNVSTNSQ